MQTAVETALNFNIKNKKSNRIRNFKNDNFNRETVDIQKCVKIKNKLK